MILKGKAKEKFEHFLYVKYDICQIKPEEEIYWQHFSEELTLFDIYEKLPNILQNALIIEFFNEQEYKIETGVYNLWDYCFAQCYWDRGFKEYKQSVVQAIKKANDLYNARYSKQK